ncbi:MAG: hypothetical protein AAGJ34_01415 [Pseudomonadota bacterium]
MPQEDTNDSIEMFRVLSQSISNDRERISSEMEANRFLLRSTLGLGSFLVIGLGAAAVYLVGASIADLKSEVLSLADSRVQAAITRNSENVREIDQISNELKAAQETYLEYRVALESLSGLKTLQALGVQDPYGNYLKLVEIEQMGDNVNDGDRAVAFQLINSILEAATVGIAEPNLVFNTAVSAGRLEFNSEAVKLATLTNYWHPSLSNRAISAEFATLYGVEFEYDGKELQEVDKPADVVRSEAWAELLKLLEVPPRQEAEQAYSRASNVAARNRSNGYFPELIATIETSMQDPSTPITSYGLVTLAKLYSWNADPDWEADYIAAIGLAFEALAEESPASSWYHHSITELLESGDSVGRFQEVLQVAQAYGITMEDLMLGMGPN